MAKSNESNTRYAIAGVLLILLTVAGAFVYLEFFNQPGSNRPDTDSTPFDDPLAFHNDSNPLELEPRANDPKPEPEAKDPEPDPDRNPVPLQAMTRFRALVTEADKSLMLRDQPDLEPAKLWEIASTLEQLESRFAPYAMLAYHGTAEAGDRIHFESDTSRSFERPDVSSSAYTIEAAPRVALWQREGVKLPESEDEAPPGVLIPSTRRLQEALVVDTITDWLTAIEGEYGATDFGESGMPLDLVVFRDLNDYLKFADKRLGLKVPNWSAGFYSAKWDVICMPVLDNTSLAEVVRHEMFHAVQAHKAPQSLLVPWFAEGSAEWLDKAAPDPGLRTHPDFARAAYGYLRTLIVQGYKLNLKEFLQQELETFYQNPELNYLLAYCFVDFVRGEEDLRALYFEFWKLMCEGTDKDNAFARTFGGLDFNDLQRRFLARIQSYPRATVPPRFSHDAPAEFFDRVPSELSGNLPLPAVDGGVSEGWYAVLGKLEEKGFDTSRAGYFKGDYDLLVVAIDSSESMDWRITTDNFDFEALSRWLFSLRYAGSLQFSRKSADGSTTEEVPASVLLTMVDSVLTDRVDEFVEAAGIKVGDEVQKNIKTSYKQFDLSANKLKKSSKRDIALHTAESIAWYWGTRQDSADVTVIDFNIEAQVEKEKNSFKTKGYNSSSSPLQRLFAKTAPNNAPGGSNGADTDWWLGFQNLVNSAADASSGRVACIFFTDGPNSLGFYGHLEQGRDDTQYALDQEKLADGLKIEWENAGLGYESQPSILQIIALPGAEGQGLDNIPQKIPQARLDEWATHFLAE